MIQLFCQYDAPWLMPFTKKELLRALSAMVLAAQQTHIGYPVLALDVYLIDDARIASINSSYLSCAGPTNVLSFPGDEDVPGVLFLSLDTFARECHLYTQDAPYYFLHLIAHGIAHLAHLDHGPFHDTIHEACLMAVGYGA
ncbi:MAG: rRNA maturation RNase YbeY [Desulfovibrio sp.]|nr:rRNA maturation RNase YbeY [Desulfovibrio sp.]